MEQHLKDYDDKRRMRVRRKKRTDNTVYRDLKEKSSLNHGDVRSEKRKTKNQKNEKKQGAQNEHHSVNDTASMW